MPALVSILTHISRVYFLGLVAEAGVCPFGDLFGGSLVPLATIGEPILALCTTSDFLSDSVVIEVDNTPSPVCCEIGVTASSPVGVVGELTGPEGLLVHVTITSDCVWDRVLS